MRSASSHRLNSYILPAEGLGSSPKDHCSGHLKVRHAGTTVVDDVLFSGGSFFFEMSKATGCRPQCSLGLAAAVLSSTSIVARAGHLRPLKMFLAGVKDTKFKELVRETDCRYWTRAITDVARP